MQCKHIRDAHVPLRVPRLPGEGPAWRVGKSGASPVGTQVWSSAPFNYWWSPGSGFCFVLVFSPLSPTHWLCHGPVPGLPIPLRCLMLSREGIATGAKFSFGSICWRCDQTERAQP